jgi:hypothetical protein
MGKTGRDGEFEHIGLLNKSPPVILTALSKLQASHEMGCDRLSEHLSMMVTKRPLMKEKYTHQGPENDVLFEDEYQHIGSGSTCVNCDGSRKISRPARDRNDPVIHYSLIASGNQVMKHAHHPGPIENTIR